MPFLCRITESGGTFDGSVIEPDTLYRPGETLTAAIVGHRAGRSVDFTKTYRSTRIGYENPVDYVSQLSEDGTAITGSWSLQDWNGSFEMYRESGIEDSQEEEAGVPVELG